MHCNRCKENNEIGVSYGVNAPCRTRSNKIWVCKNCENNEDVAHCSNWGCNCSGWMEA